MRGPGIGARAGRVLSDEGGEEQASDETPPPPETAEPEDRNTPPPGEENRGDEQEVLVAGPWRCLYCGEDIAERVRRGGWPGRDRET